MANAKKKSKERPQEILSYLTNKGWPYELDGENYKIDTCVFCANTSKNFEIHKDRGMYKCWACGEQGSFYDLRDRLGDVAFSVRKVADDTSHITPERKVALTQMAMEHHGAIWTNPAILNYVRQRGFDDLSIRKFRLGAYTDYKGHLRLSIPHIVGDQIVNIKSRALDSEVKPKWIQEKDSQKVLFNHNAIGKHDAIILTEGELKTVALWQMGFENAISLTGGVQNFRPEWVDLMDTVDKIYLCLDSDPAGQKGAEDLAMRLGPEKCYNIILKDAKDPDEWFFERGHTAEEFEFLLRTSKKVDIKNIVSVNKAFGLLQEEYEMDEVDNYRGLQTPWEEVNKLIHGFKPGELIVLSAPPKVGKTTWALDVALYQAKIGNPTLFFCMEMSAKRLARKMTANVQNITDGEIDYDHITLARQALRKRPLYLPEGVKRGMQVEEVFEALKAAYRRYGIKLMVFDNLHFMIRSSTNQREQLGEASQNFKLLAEELKIPIILIVHPRKLNKKGPMTADDFRETGAIHADADQIIIVHRHKNDAADVGPDADPNGSAHGEKTTLLSQEADIIVDSGRFTEGGKATLWFDGAKSKYMTFEEAGKIRSQRH